MIGLPQFGERCSHHCGSVCVCVCVCRGNKKDLVRQALLMANTHNAPVS